MSKHHSETPVADKFTGKPASATTVPGPKSSGEKAPPAKGHSK